MAAVQSTAHEDLSVSAVYVFGSLARRLADGTAAPRTVQRQLELEAQAGSTSGTSIGNTGGDAGPRATRTSTDGEAAAPSLGRLESADLAALQRAGRAGGAAGMTSAQVGTTAILQLICISCMSATSDIRSGERHNDPQCLHLLWVWNV